MILGNQLHPEGLELFPVVVVAAAVAVEDHLYTSVVLMYLQN
jgi:hypothetical protein